MRICVNCVIILVMIRIIAGGKKSAGWALEGITEYEKRLRKPFDIKWEIYDEEKLTAMLEKWPFDGRDYVIICDERGKNISSPELAEKIEQNFIHGTNVVIIIGGAYGFSDEIRAKASFLWSFSRLVFPHMLFRLMVTEQIYRAQEIVSGGKYHHE